MDQKKTAVISCEVLVPVSPPEVRKEPFSPSLARLRTWHACPGVWACPGSSVDRVCMSVDVEPALACPRTCGLRVHGQGAGPRVGGYDSLSL